MKIIKCVIIGDENVGKTTLIAKYTMHSIHDIDEYNPTVFNTHLEISYQKASIEAVQLELWDTDGLKDHNHYRSSFAYPGTHVVFICFSVVSRDSFRNVETKWYPEVQRFCPNASIFLVGMKLDLLNDKETLDKLDKENKSPILRFEGLELAEKIRAYKYCECSAETGYKLQRLFNQAINTTLKNTFLKDENYWEDLGDKRSSNMF